MTVKSALGEDDLLLVGFSGHEGISELFRFELDLIAENATDVPFDRLLGEKATVSLGLPAGGKRYFNGIISRVSQGARDQTFTSFRAELVPRIWLLTRIAQSRIFQQLPVPEILQQVFTGLDVRFELQGTFEPRDYCVQYRETDFSFVSRLMEEEGIYYFFTHADEGHTMILANTPRSHPALNPENLVYEEIVGGQREDERVLSWEKSQQLRSGKYTLWDHSFELPHKKLEATQIIQDSVPVGRVTHKLKVANNDKFEIFDFPGEYAQRFDGVDPGGGDRAGDLSKIFQDNTRTTTIRMEQEALPSILVHATSNCRHLVPGHKFTLERHFNADGGYVITGVDVVCQLEGNYRSGGNTEFHYENSFSCIPLALPFRPARLTPKPVIHGTQTAVVVGPPGEEIFTDKYSRVKVQFHWDRDGKYDGNSSCWIRVATPLAGRQWGTIYIPRIGQEVMVAFQEGDPDQPVIVGGLYNADQVPPYQLPDEKTKTGYKSYSSLGGQGFNEIRFEDKKGDEDFFAHAEKDMDIRVKRDSREWIGRDRHLITTRDNSRQVERNENVIVKQDLVHQVDRDHHLKIAGKQAIKVEGSHSCEVAGNVAEEYKSDHSETVTGNYDLKGQNIVIEATSGLTVKVGGSFIKFSSSGIWIKAGKVNINSGGSAQSGSACSLVSPAAPAAAMIAANANPGDKSPTYENQIAQRTQLQQEADEAPTHAPDPEKTSWIEIELLDEDDNPVPGERYMIKLPDGTTIASGTLDENGFARVDGIDPGTCQVTFPDIDKEAWE
jgi:type VI secretion system secreted protein VgrG